jgi:acetyl esterase/lipase
VSDIEALFDYISTLDISLHRLVLAGFSGGAYPLRLGAVLAAKESKRPSPRFTVLGCISFVGMGGDFLLDYWLTPRPLEGDQRPLKDQQEQAAAAVGRLAEGEEASDCPYTEGLSGYHPSRGAPWDLWRVAGTINDSITGQDGFSERLRQVEYSKRIDMIPPQFHPVYPQIYFRDNANLIPPFLLVHGEADPMVPHMETLTTKTSLGDSAELISVPFGDHGLQNGGILEKSGQAAIIRMAQWAVERGATQ